MNRIVELMLAIRRDNDVFYHKDTKTFDRYAFSENELKHLSFDERLPLKDENNFRLPSYKEIDHEEIMRFFVRECVEEKDVRKQLFDILRRRKYMDAYLDKLHELNLYDEFVDACGDVYMQIFSEWAEKNELTDFKRGV